MKKLTAALLLFIYTKLIFISNLAAQVSSSDNQSQSSSFTLDKNFSTELESLTLELEKKVTTCLPELSNKKGILKLASCPFTKGARGIRAIGNTVSVIPIFLIAQLKILGSASRIGGKSVIKMTSNVLAKQNLTADLDKTIFDLSPEGAQEAADVIAKYEKDTLLQEQIMAKLLSLLPLTASKANRQKLMTIDCAQITQVTCTTIGDLGMNFLTKYAVLATRSKGNTKLIVEELNASGDIDKILISFRKSLAGIGIHDVSNSSSIESMRSNESTSQAE